MKQQQSYENHQAWFESQFADDQQAIVANFDKMHAKDTANYRRHLKMFAPLTPFLTRESSWLTVGDGYGVDTAYLCSKSDHVWGSDITDTMLKIAKQKKYIRDFSIENAEKLSFFDNKFDYALCKEAYHHFPRPYIAVYEMLRVTRKAIFFVEPHDTIQKMPLLLWLKNMADLISPKMINKIWKNRSSFETVGNYVYKMSDREIEKIAMGIGLPAVAFCGINDYYIGGEKFYESPADPAFLAKINRKTGLNDILAKLHLIPYQLLCAIIFKELPTNDVIQQLQQLGFQYIELPKNPYLTKK